MGVRIAHNLSSEKVIDYIELSLDYSIVELKASKKISGKTLAELDIRAKYGCTILGIKRNGDLNISPSPDDLIMNEDILIAIGRNDELQRFEDIGI